MRTLLNQRNNRLILAALAVGSLALPAAVAAQSSSSSAKKTTHTSGSSTAPSKGTSSSAKKTTSKSKRGSGRKSKRVKGQAAPTPERINEIQGALAKHGFYAGEPTGKWDDSTTESMKKFQAANGLNPSGKFDALTLQKLGLGSETAGLGAPTPPPNSSNRLLSSKVQRDEVKNEPE
jgi:peptidoglycan hydrolase-like protein with peptidoglycan-binding domain